LNPEVPECALKNAYDNMRKTQKRPAGGQRIRVAGNENAGARAAGNGDENDD
jgi:hypothetical protein